MPDITENFNKLAEEISGIIGFDAGKALKPSAGLYGKAQALVNERREEKKIKQMADVIEKIDAETKIVWDFRNEVDHKTAKQLKVLKGLMGQVKAFAKGQPVPEQHDDGE